MATSPLQKRIVLKKNEDRRVAAGHPWVFSNEIRETLGAPATGDVVEVHASSGRSLGVGFYHAHSLIAVRILSARTEEIDHSFFLRRIGEAAAMRSRVYPGITALRIVHGESDQLSGLVIDRYNDQFALQTLSYGMDARLGTIADVIEEMFHPSAIIERDESPLRSLDGLPARTIVLRGSPGPTVIREHGIEYEVHVLEGQKTGFFLDQRENRLLVRDVSRGARVLDCFSNDGGFALNAARGGASRVLGIDISPEAVTRARANAARNGIACCTFEQADVFESLVTLHAASSRFDVVILDPPSFARSRKTVPAARKGYRDLHRRALRVLEPGGFLLSASCSHHIQDDTFLGDIDRSCREEGRRAKLVAWRGAALDHPTLPTVPETAYLKMALLCVS